MSNPTSNFGWQMPTPTDLVTDLPADFEVFGQAVDTSMADLKGGTTGQILSKATNTDMDFVWITNDQGDITAVNVTSPITGGGTSGAITVGIQSASTSQSGAVQLSDSTSTTSSVLAATPTAVKSAYDLAAAAIPKSTVTAKGSIVAASASSTPAQLAVGNNGETLVADSSTSTGLRYQGTIAAGKNFLINGGFDIWQRSTSATLVTVGSYIAPDRMACTSDSGGNGTASQVTSSLPTGFRYGLKLQRTAGNTSVGIISVAQFLETSNSIPLAGQTVTVSFWAKAGANFSAGSSALLVRGFTGTGTDQSGGFGTWTGYAEPISSNPIITTSWVRYSVTGTLASTATQFGIRIGYTPSGTAGADDSLQITGMQVEIGSVATNFLRTGGTIQGELAACQRYYFRLGAGCANIAAGVQFGHYLRATATSTTNLFGELSYPVTMRRTPTAIDFSTVGWIVSWGAGVNAISAITIYDGGNVVGSNPQSAVLQMTTTGATSGTSYPVLANNSTASFIGLSAEL